MVYDVYLYIYICKINTTCRPVYIWFNVCKYALGLLANTPRHRRPLRTICRALDISIYIYKTHLYIYNFTYSHMHRRVFYLYPSLSPSLSLSACLSAWMNLVVVDLATLNQRLQDRRRWLGNSRLKGWRSVLTKLHSLVSVDTTVIPRSLR